MYRLNPGKTLYLRVKRVAFGAELGLFQKHCMSIKIYNYILHRKRTEC